MRRVKTTATELHEPPMSPPRTAGAGDGPGSPCAEGRAVAASLQPASNDAWPRPEAWVQAAKLGCARRNPKRASLLPKKAKRSASLPSHLCLAAAPRHLERIFLREQITQWYLSVTELNSVASCVMTELPVSLFICHRGKSDTDNVRLGFEHEGLPALGCFLAPRRSWSWREAVGLASADVQLRCEEMVFDAGKEFRWHQDSTLQFISTGQWLHVDPSSPAAISFHAINKSSWEALPARSS